MRIVVFSLIAVLFATSVTCADPDSVERDYSEELPRVTPTSPDDALATFRVADGYRIELAASEPVVYDPVAIAFDENGRLFVVEMRGYSEDEEDNLGRVRLLVDEDGDGRYEKSTVYVDGLSWPTAIACYEGGVFVGAAPDVHYFKDTNDDGVADERRLVFTGLGRSNVQGLVNTFQWGLDNRIHAATSSSGAELRKPDQPESAALTLRGRDFAWDPKTLEVAPTSGGGQHGASFDPWGDKFVCSNSNHIQAVMFEDRYVARNPYLAAPSPRVSIAADGPQADVYRRSPVEPWRIVRTRLRVKGIVRGPVEGGGRAAGYFTGATGVTIYTGDAWPREHYGIAIVGDVGSNLIHRKRIQRQGVGYLAERFDEKSEFVASTDIWFRPVQFANGPDGALYVLDMSREVIEHPKSLPPVIKRHLDLTSGRDRGRIYRIVPDDFERPAPVKLGRASAADLVANIDHPNGWRRETAARLIYERQERSSAPQLLNVAKSSPLPEGRIRALYVLDGLASLTPQAVLRAMSDEHPQVRRHGARLAEAFLNESPEVRARVVELVDDADVRVVCQVAFSLGQWQDERRSEPLAKIARRFPDDQWIRLAVFSSLSTGAGAALAELAGDEEFRKSAAGKTWLGQLAAQIGKQRRSDDVAVVLQMLRSLASDKQAKSAFETIVQKLGAKEGTEFAKQIAAATGGKSTQMTQSLVAEAAKTAVDTKAKAAERAEAIHFMRLGGWAAAKPLIDDLLAPSQPIEVQSALLSTLATFPNDEVAKALISRWRAFTPSLRSKAAETLFSRPAWQPLALEAVAKGSISPADLQPGRLKVLASSSNPDVAKAAGRLLEQSTTGKRQEVLDQYQSALTIEGDEQQGHKIFKKICANCHQVQGEGHPIGPNLAAMQARGPAAILSNVIDPNREVNPLYLTYTIITYDGRSLSGMIAGETATSITLKKEENKTDTVLRIDIEEMRSNGVSLMPEGMEKQISPQQMADLIAYLQSVR